MLQKEQFIFKLGAVVGKQPGGSVCVYTSPVRADESGPQLGQWGKPAVPTSPPSLPRGPWGVREGFGRLQNVAWVRTGQGQVGWPRDGLWLGPHQGDEKLSSLPSAPAPDPSGRRATGWLATLPPGSFLCLSCSLELWGLRAAGTPGALPTLPCVSAPASWSGAPSRPVPVGALWGEEASAPINSVAASQCGRGLSAFV